MPTRTMTKTTVVAVKIWNLYQLAELLLRALSDEMLTLSLVWSFTSCWPRMSTLKRYPSLTGEHPPSKVVDPKTVLSSHHNQR